MNVSGSCIICGNNDFVYSDVLWSELIMQWGLDAHEVEYINRQQGLACSRCGNNLRTQVLSKAILSSYGFDGLFVDFLSSDIARNLSILEINEVGMLTQYFSNMQNHRIVKYPYYDMMDLDLDAEAFDLVIHSDTLEHIQDAVMGLSECKRVLKKNGRCIYTVPMIVERMTRSRKGMELSFHGNNNMKNDDYIVHTEFGADAWLFPLKAGFKKVTIHNINCPDAFAIEASL